MATADSEPQNQPESPPTPSKNDPVDSLVDTLQNTTLGELTASSSDTSHPAETPPRKLQIYTRSQLLLLSKSPLVQSPNDLPAFKDWFGDWHEQQASSKKDADTSAVPGQRDRRFRRDPEDGDAPARPSFRSTLSQPSQMGNFRHQSIRTTERDRDRDGDRERDRDKEGQERLRSLSDKYDRDRLALAGSALRIKDRDSAPHLSTGSAMRLGQTQSTTAGRRNEGKDIVRRKIGENGDDWRRGDPSRAGRDDRTESGRRDRDNRDRARSKSKTRRDPSSTRRERDKDDKEKDKDGPRDREDRRRGDRDDYNRRDRDEHHRRDWDDHYVPDRETSYRDNRDRQKDSDRDREVDDDPRRWRDDGKRDERITVRREREKDRGWDRWEPSHDRVEDRDNRPRRNGARERRPGGDDAKERDERRERDKEKEPAWMETYVPSTPGGGILGGQGVNGELDSIQAWKKGLKEKERKEKESDTAVKTEPKAAESLSKAPAAPVSTAESPLDEIQLFKLMMKKEAEKKEVTQSQNVEEGVSTTSSSQVQQSGITQPVQSEHSTAIVASTVAQPTKQSSMPPPVDGQAAANDESRSLLSLITSPDSANGPKTITLTIDPKNDMPPPAVSRLFAQPQTPSALAETQTSASASASFNPPAGSRLLAFGARTSTTAGNSTMQLSRNTMGHDTALNLHNTISPNVSLANIQKVPGPAVPGGPVGLLPNNDFSMHFGGDSPLVSNPRATPSDTGRSARSFSPFGQPTSSYSYEEIQELSRLGQAEHIRRTSVASSFDRNLASEAVSPYFEINSVASNLPASGLPYDLGGSASANYAAGKGSRFAKFFDGKSRDQPQIVPPRKAPTAAFGPSLAQLPNQRQASLAQNGLLANNGEGRTMEEIFTMLQNSAQTQRPSPQITQQGRIPHGGGQFNQNAVDIHALQLQQLQQQQQQQLNQRLDSLYDSRLDDRSFVPDGMVPGLRPAPRPRSRGPIGALYNDGPDESLQFNPPRVLQQQRNVEQPYPGPGASMYGMGRNGGIQLQQQQFRGNPSPAQNPILGSSQRLPPGLANLGGRPPHDPSQYINGPMGIPGGALPGNLPPNPPTQNFNNFNGGGHGGGPGFGGNLGSVPGRGPMGAPHHQNQIPLNQLTGIGPNHGIDLRSVNQAHLHGMGGTGGAIAGLGGGVRGLNVQQGPGSQMPSMGMRQAPQQQHVPSHMMQQMLPPHLQQQHGLSGGNTQGAQDLMALLMGGHRD